MVFPVTVAMQCHEVMGGGVSVGDGGVEIHSVSKPDVAGEGEERHQRRMGVTGHHPPFSAGSFLTSRPSTSARE